MKTIRNHERDASCGRPIRLSAAVRAAGAVLLLIGLAGCNEHNGRQERRVQPTAETPAALDVPINELRDAYFGELHVHSAYSLDSYIFANRNDPEAAFRFARGEPIKLAGGQTKQLRFPLDFVAVTDHAETMGDFELCTQAESSAYANQICQQVRSGDLRAFGRIVSGLSSPKPKRWMDLCGEDGARCVDAARGTWQRIQAAAERFYQPGKFTTLLGYEFSPVVPGPTVNGAFGMLHRNVIFRTGTVPDNVFSSFDGTGEELMKWLEVACREPCRALTIPHNSNFSWGRFFWDRNSDGSPWTKEILERRARAEPLVEIFQIKGSSECQDGVGFTDEECRFENLFGPCPPDQAIGCEGANSLVTNAVIRGLDVEAKWGVNPFKYGFIGATDNHNGAPGDTDESSYEGHLGVTDAKPGMRLTPPPGVPEENSPMLRFNPGGVAGVWAERNTREAIWDALARRETFGTSGTRIRVRFFGAFDLPADMHKRHDFVRIGYARGVPMGGDLRAAPAGAAPRFSIWASRDPNGAPLQKIQIVKGWNEDGRTSEKVYDIACSDGITPNARTGLCRDNGASVDVATCRISADKGAAELATTWTDPDFDPSKRAVYYVRVLENPVCRWSTHDAHRLRRPLPKGVPPTVKERAWTSPIWYTPDERQG